MIRTAFFAGFAFAIGMGAVGTANAGLFDFLFGPRQPVAPVARPVSDHPDVTIAPRRAPKKRIVRRIEISPQDMLARTIDPVKNPRWYLEDPTLRKGDILVLNDRVLVFKGGKVGDAVAYVSLNDTRLLSRKERIQVSAMTKRPAGFQASPTVASAEPVAKQPTKVRIKMQFRSADLKLRGERG